MHLFSKAHERLRPEAWLLPVPRLQYQLISVSLRKMPLKAHGNEGFQGFHFEPHGMWMNGEGMQGAVQQAPSRPNIGALIIRIGFRGPLYYNYTKEPPR